MKQEGRMEKKLRRSFSREFKVEAVRLVEERGLSAAAESLGVGTNLLCRWRQAVRAGGDEAFRDTASRSLLEEENRRLKIENRRLREDAEILKKASAYFAKHLR
jgi:transposase